MLGYDVHGWGRGRNIRGAKTDLPAIARQVEDLHVRSKLPVSLIGWSRGGMLAREVAREIPHAVRLVITLGSPFNAPHASNVGAFWQAITGEKGAVAIDPSRFAHYGRPIPVPATDTTPDGRVVVGIRPEAFEDSAFAEPSLPRMDVTVEVVEELGADTHVLFSVAEPRVEVGEVRAATGEEDATMGAVEGSLFTARVDPGTAAKPAASLRLAVDPSRFHYFDRETGLRFEAGRELAAVAN